MLIISPSTINFGPSGNVKLAAKRWRSVHLCPLIVNGSHLRAFLEPRAWYDLVPDQNHAVLVAGYGTFSDRGNVEDNSYATAARTSDGALVVVYAPTIRTLTVNMAQLSGSVTAEWYDPSLGVYTPIDGSPFSNSGSRKFSSPGNNGDGDWVLVLESPR